MLTESPLRFLVVEDNPLSNQLICNQLTDLGHQVVGQAFNAPQAVALTEQLRPDVVLMDLQMPNPQTGQEEALAGIRGAQAIQAACPTPVVVLTAYESPDLIYEANMTGVGAYLIKPPDPYAIERAALIARARFADLQELRRLNQHLAAEVAARQQAEAELEQYTGELEELVVEKFFALEQEHAKVIHLDKLAALGEMATGVAHELTQPLTAINFEVEYLAAVADKVGAAGEEHALPLSAADLQEMAHHLKEDLTRCQRLIDHLRTFGRLTSAPPSLVTLNQPIEMSLLLVGARLRHRNIALQLALADDLPPILAEPYRLEQVFLNLIGNAEYALEQQRQAVNDAAYQKTLTITTGVVGAAVQATVQDNGCGIPPEAQKQLFGAFFTTKPAGEGTGLGLSISRGIVTEFGGQITFESAVGVGTTFTLRFPIASEDALLAAGEAEELPENYSDQATSPGRGG